MRRGYRLQALVYSSLIFLLLPVACGLFTIQAADSTPSADIKSKLEDLKKEIASKAAVLKKEITQKLENKAFVGVVKTKSDHSITLATKGGIKITSVNEDTNYQDDTKKVKNFSLASVKEEDNIAALGDIDDTGVLIAKKIVLLPPTTNQKPKTILWGQILSISEKLITIRDRESKNITLSTTKDTQLLNNKKGIALKDLKINDYVISTGVFDEDESRVGTLNTGFLYVLTQASSLNLKEASPSASFKASPSPSTKPTSKPSSAK